jgi:negative regulator of flagellin synthesis FlgM
MTMKINADPKIAHLPPLAGAGTTERKPAAGPGVPGSEPSAKVLLSSAALGAPAPGADAGIDTDKVARISAAIENGSFKINPEAIADKLIANAREQLAKAYGKVGGGS